jgi:hypothetical protein
MGKLKSKLSSDRTGKGSARRTGLIPPVVVTGHPQDEQWGFVLDRTAPAVIDLNGLARPRRWCGLQRGQPYPATAQPAKSFARHRSQSPKDA